MATPGGTVPIPLLRSNSSVVQCPYCGRTGPTITDGKNGLLVWLSCMGILVMGCSCGCCLIPFCVNRLKDVEHRCSSCRQVLSTYERL